MRFSCYSDKMPDLAALCETGHHSVKSCVSTLFVFILLTTLTGVTPAIAAERKAQAQLSVGATILTTIRVKVMSQPSQISIERKHVAQGYIDVEDGSVLLITSNSPDGFMMSVSFDPILITNVTTRLSQGGATEGEGMIPVRTQQVRDEPIRVSYRLHLSPQAHTGNLPWPLALSFTPRAA